VARAGASGEITNLVEELLVHDSQVPKLPVNIFLQSA
jgi:hypothetical protein